MAEPISMATAYILGSVATGALGFLGGERAAKQANENQHRQAQINAALVEGSYANPNLMRAYQGLQGQTDPLAAGYMGALSGIKQGIAGVDALGKSGLLSDKDLPKTQDQTSTNTGAYLGDSFSSGARAFPEYSYQQPQWLDMQPTRQEGNSIGYNPSPALTLPQVGSSYNPTQQQPSYLGGPTMNYNLPPRNFWGM